MRAERSILAQDLLGLAELGRIFLMGSHVCDLLPDQSFVALAVDTANQQTALLHLVTGELLYLPGVAWELGGTDDGFAFVFNAMSEAADQEVQECVDIFGKRLGKREHTESPSIVVLGPADHHISLSDLRSQWTMQLCKWQVAGFEAAKSVRMYLFECSRGACHCWWSVVDFVTFLRLTAGSNHRLSPARWCLNKWQAWLRWWLELGFPQGLGKKGEKHIFSAVEEHVCAWPAHVISSVALPMWLARLGLASRYRGGLADHAKRRRAVMVLEILCEAVGSTMRQLILLPSGKPALQLPLPLSGIGAVTLPMSLGEVQLANMWAHPFTGIELLKASLQSRGVCPDGSCSLAILMTCLAEADGQIKKRTRSRPCLDMLNLCCLQVGLALDTSLRRREALTGIEVGNPPSNPVPELRRYWKSLQEHAGKHRVCSIQIDGTTVARKSIMDGAVIFPDNVAAWLPLQACINSR